MTIYYFAAFGAYMALLLGIGWISHQKQDSNAEFIVGNRSLNFWLIALSAHASDMSAWLFMGLPLAIYLQGLSGAWIAFGLVLGMFLTWQFVAQKLRVLTEKYESYTLPTFFEKRFEDSSGVLRVLTALVLLFFLTFYLAAGLTAIGLLLESIFQIDYWWGLTIATLVVVTYTYGGGFVTIAWTDLFQALFLLAAIVIVPILACLKIDQVKETLFQLNTLKPGFLSLFGEMSLSSVLAAAFSAFAWGLGYFGMPHIITKFLGIKEAKELKKSRNVGISWQIIALTAAVSVGIIGFARFQGAIDNPELIFVELVKELFHPFLAGFVLCGVLAANLSTMDSQLLVCASAVGEDFFKWYGGSYATPKNLVRASRGGVIFIALCALGIAFKHSKTILEAVFYAWAGLGSAFGPLILASLYDSKANKKGAIAGLIVGTLIGSGWTYLNSWILPFEIPATIPGFGLSFLTIWGVSRLNPTARSPQLK